MRLCLIGHDITRLRLVTRKKVKPKLNINSRVLDKLKDVAIMMDPDLDQVAIAKTDISAGICLEYDGRIIEIKDFIKKGHRFAITDIREGEFVRQYGHAFGQSKGVLEGEIIFPSKIDNVLPKIELEKFKEPKKTARQKEYLQKTFLGYVRKNGMVGTRNYYLVIPTSMCVSEAALQISLNLENDKDVIHNYRNIDGIVAISHTEGCGCASNLQIDRLLMLLKGYVNHPNVGGCLIMDLGCEQTNKEKVYGYLKSTINAALKPIDWITVQENGGTISAVKKAVSKIRDRLEYVNQAEREPCYIEKLIVGTECGASDSFSGITANPVIGKTVDKVIYGGGSAILSEIPEMIGAFEMLLHRFRNVRIANKFRNIVDWYIDIAERLGLTLDDNLVPKNIEGGLINNYIKSLGAVLKGGITAIEDVVEYGEQIKKKGLNIMQGPGGDLESVTGLVASGSNIVCFSTGYGSITGNAICPVIKISSNNDTFEKLNKDIDFNAGELLSGGTNINTLGEDLLKKVIAVASGTRTCSEKCKQRQFQVWTAGKLSL